LTPTVCSSLSASSRILKFRAQFPTFFFKKQGACFFFTWLPSPTTENPDHNTTPNQLLLASNNLRLLLRTMQTREFPAFKLLDSGVKSICLQVHKLLEHMEKKTTTTTRPKQELPGANEKREKETTTTTTKTTNKILSHKMTLNLSKV
jgi:hypothetical protein